ncbi:hypothetical protein EMIHUDRAFT_193801 [Emiliania huxleyi CCMP1516]|uniref:Tubby C-terminal domain-containing protein n=2 Tax=Emiliania huxleyi TaxID=2903 RepID=A0A0D3L0G0_EMIH1|nr:hypothetical protein EMIHUDRAFT_193801 [Emiliania huxleyi CCMP1516]EOD41495.1 hypothetical protein EMIHUDRAFT_193801 [Emiliania huxleyi CCMP1516]|eukprot:XP_005793924.1 hypothetical protein EMIHUDRAFT_193801 [Emiliania huxleyi CCMP1516]
MKRGAASTDPIELADEDSDGDKRRSLSLSRRPAARNLIEKEFCVQKNPTKCLGWGLKGFVVQSPDDAQGALTVSLRPCATVLRRRAGEGQKAKYGNYHIIKLGPIVDGLYDYSVVSNASPASQLYILTRD